MWARSRHRAHGEGYFYGESVEDPVKCTGEVPILHKPLRPMAGYYPQRAETFCFGGTSRQSKRGFLCDLCAW